MRRPARTCVSCGAALTRPRLFDPAGEYTPLADRLCGTCSPRAGMGTYGNVQPDPDRTFGITDEGWRRLRGGRPS
jgi:hypothetical protein